MFGSLIKNKIKRFIVFSINLLKVLNQKIGLINIVMMMHTKLKGSLMVKKNIKKVFASYLKKITIFI